MRLATLPNLICVARIALAVPIVWLLVHEQYAWTLLLFAIAAMSDALDGWLAKTFGWTSELGRVLDPLADKLLLVSVFITLALLGLVPVWLAAVVVARDLVIAFGAWAYIAWFGPLHGQPTAPSKLNTVVQILYVIIVVADAAYGPLPGAWLVTLGAAVLLTTVVSGIDYVATYVRRAIGVSRSRRVA